MIVKVKTVTDNNLQDFLKIRNNFGSYATICYSGSFPLALENCETYGRGTNELLVGYIATQPSGSQLVLETVFLDPKRNLYKGDLHVVNFVTRELKSHYKGWGTWDNYYGDKHHEDKSYLVKGSLSPYQKSFH